MDSSSGENGRKKRKSLLRGDESDEEEDSSNTPRAKSFSFGDIVIDRKNYSWIFYLVDRAPPIFGVNFLRRYDLSIDVTSGSLFERPVCLYLNKLTLEEQEFTE
ncbi:unnamed protein product [Lepeophtheirus salmonis]|uniref:(salmon louse) hypothetical protein n=1 Tax=Lepeophtheirus salmonis TaxID=72036 RepID=A0A7R8DCZ6_LEPSM|nr:unnamed protein product [Lepeophtheirus salmonis]CAF3046654.1 unnamed protein product [Lepeophtheirus salmonis]